jgi:hypothetical protein
MNLPADIKNVLENLKVDPQDLMALKSDLYVQCGSIENARQLFDLMKPRYACSFLIDKIVLRISDVVQ